MPFSSLYLYIIIKQIIIVTLTREDQLYFIIRDTQISLVQKRLLIIIISLLESPQQIRYNILALLVLYFLSFSILIAISLILVFLLLFPLIDIIGITSIIIILYTFLSILIIYYTYLAISFSFIIQNYLLQFNQFRISYLGVYSLLSILVYIYQG